MRRLSELITFPRPWYRKQLVRRLFFGEHSVPANPSTLNTNFSNTQRPESACSSSTLPYSALKFKLTGKNNTINSSYLTRNQSPLKSASSTNHFNQRFLFDYIMLKKYVFLL